ncbi:hypothetical protein CHISP_3608 [Chitinispirillum alkaliphilum]|nr:hypothetical protein CHISP_3608 [Chitinispirillum alkaliphilum]
MHNRPMAGEYAPNCFYTMVCRIISFQASKTRSTANNSALILIATSPWANPLCAILHKPIIDFLRQRQREHWRRGGIRIMQIQNEMKAIKNILKNKTNKKHKNSSGKNTITKRLSMTPLARQATDFYLHVLAIYRIFCANQFGCE